MIEIRDAGEKGQGLFAATPYRVGQKVIDLGGIILSTDELTEDFMALQIGPDRWLCSQGEHLDDFANHSCDPNVGFSTGELSLFAVKNISINDEITWDYSTSINEPGWSLDCRCGAENCRQVILPWYELCNAERKRLRPISLSYLR